MKSRVNAIAISDLSGNLTFVNQSFIKMWGYSSQSEVIGKSAVSLWYSENDAKNLFNDLQEKGGWDGEITARLRDGSSFSASLTVNMINKDSNEDHCYVFVFCSLSEHRQNEEGLPGDKDSLDVIVTDHYKELTGTRKEIGREFTGTCLEFKKTVATILSALAGVLDIDSNIRNSLNILRILCGASSAYIFRLNEDSTAVDVIDSWCSGDVVAGTGNQKNILTDMVPWWMEKIKNDGMIYIEDVSTLPPEAMAELESINVITQKIKSILVLALQVRGKLYGFVEFENVEFKDKLSDHHQAFLGTFSGILGNALERKQAEEEAEKSLSILRMTLESTGDGILVLNGGGKIVNYNQKFIKMWGIPENMKSLEEMSEIAPFLTGQVKCRRFAHEEINQVTHVLINKNSNLIEFRDGRIFECYSKEQKTGEKTTYRVLCFHDVTGSRQAESETKRAYIEMNQIFNTSSEGICVINKDFIIININRKFSSMMGVKEDNTKGKHCYEICHYHFCHSLICPLIRIVMGEKSVEMDVERKDEGGITRSYIMAAAPLTWPDGQMIGIVVSYRDITDRKKAVVQLAEREELYRTLVETLPDAVILADFNYNILMANTQGARFMGFNSEQELISNGNNILSIIETEDQKHITDDLRLFLMTDSIRNIEKNIIRKDGSSFPAEIRCSLTKDMNGHPKSTLFVIRDVSDRKRAEEQARLQEEKLYQADKMVALGTLVASVAHEINNPNNTIFLNTPALKESFESIIPILDQYYDENGDFVMGGLRYTEMRDNIFQSFSRIIESSQHIKTIVEDLKGFTRQDTCGMRQIDVNAVIESVVSLFSNQIKRYTNNFLINYGRSLPKIRGDFQRLEQVIINLIQNACHALQDKREKISISTLYDREKQGVVVEVKDEGIGIPADILPKITEPFFTTKRESGGIGLGLLVSQKIVKEHGGKLYHTSEPGKGTTATVFLPDTEINQNL